MVIYFSGTGNSKHIAQRIAEQLQDELIGINGKIKTNDTQPMNVNDRLVIVTPTYAWRIPLVVQEWIRKTAFIGTSGVWFVMSCGGEIGNAAKYNKQLCDEKKFSYMGTAQILMPENYIALFGTPSDDEARGIIAKAEPVLDEIIALIKENKKFSLPRNNVYDKFMSGPVNKVFYPFCVKAKAFRVSEECIGCGKCETLCPMNNISVVTSKPVWGKDCTHCMACISYCPTKAIEYGKNSIGKERYTFEKL